MDEFYFYYTRNQRAHYENVVKLIKDLDPNNKSVTLTLPEPQFIKKIKEKKGQDYGADKCKPSDIVQLFSGEEVSKLFLYECNVVSAELFLAWEVMGDLLLTRSAQKLFSSRRNDYFRFLKIRYGESVFRDAYEVTDFSEFVNGKMGKDHQNLATGHRQSRYYQTIDQKDESKLNVTDSFSSINTGKLEWMCSWLTLRCFRRLTSIRLSSWRSTTKG